METKNNVFTLPTLYKSSVHNHTLEWNISVVGDELVINWGVSGGKIQESKTKIILNSSGRNYEEQGKLEATSRWKEKQRKDGYSERISNVPVLGETMLAVKWEPNKNQIKRWPVWVEEKLDGVRARAYITNGEVVLLTRNKKEILHLEHIKDDLKFFLVNLSKSLENTSTLVLDGELCSPVLGFDQLSGIVRKLEKPDSDEESISYYLFDVDIPNMTYDERYSILNAIYSKLYYLEDGIHHAGLGSVKLLIPRLAYSKDDILKAHDEYVKGGYEGIIIRKVGGCNEKERKESYYIGRRCSNILKYKTFLDEEGTIIGAESGAGSEEGAVIWLIKDPGGKEFYIRPRGTLAQRKQLYMEKEKYYGCLYRYRFQEFTELGYPRFPVGIGFIEDR
jgi:ATP-dependent DNA ligase